MVRQFFIISVGVIVGTIVNLPLLPAHAVGLALQPVALRIAAEWGSTGSGEILVSNVTDQPAMYRVHNDAAGPELTAQPATFRLDPGGSQLVQLLYRPRWVADRQAMLAVVAWPLGRAGVRVASGVRYPVELVSTSRGLNAGVRGGLLVVAGLFAWWAWRQRFPRAFV